MGVYGSEAFVGERTEDALAQMNEQVQKILDE